MPVVIAVALSADSGSKRQFRRTERRQQYRFRKETSEQNVWDLTDALAKRKHLCSIKNHLIQF